MVTSDPFDPEKRDDNYLGSYCPFHFLQEEMAADTSLDLIVLCNNQTMVYSVVKCWIFHSHNLIDVDLEKGLTVHFD